MISAIVAVDNNWGIGFNGHLLERIPLDIARFKNLTENHIVVCGRKTWDSIPKKPLSDRLTIVISRNGFKVEPGAIFLDMPHLKVHLEHIKNNDEIEWFIIGGGEIYKELLPYCNRVYITKIYKDCDNVDTYFPNLDQNEEWKHGNTSLKGLYKDLSYQYIEYNRIS